MPLQAWNGLDDFGKVVSKHGSFAAIFVIFSRLKRQLQSARLRKKHAGLQVGSGQEQQGNRIGVASRMWHGSAESAHEGILGFHHFLLPSLLGLVCPGTFGARGGHQHGHV